MPNQSSRNGRRPILVAVHTNEGANTHALPDRAAENLIVWMNNNGVSYHVVVDDDSRPRMIADEYASWSLRSGNPISLNVCIIGRAAFTRAEWFQHLHMINLMCDQIREWCHRHGIPMRKLTPAQVAANMAGIIGHWDWTVGKRDGSHTDPGAQFIWDYVMQRLTGTAPPPPIPNGDNDMDANHPVQDYYTANPHDRLPVVEAIAWGTTHAAHARDAARAAVDVANRTEAKVQTLTDLVGQLMSKVDSLIQGGNQ